MILFKARRCAPCSFVYTLIVKGGDGGCIAKPQFVYRPKVAGRRGRSDVGIGKAERTFAHNEFRPISNGPAPEL